MGSGSSSNGRLFGTLAQSLTSAPLEQTEPYLEKKLGQDLALDQELVETNPELLLRECEEALQRRPARPQRDLVYLNCMAPCRRKHSTSIRIMQWNILAQGRRSQLVDIRAFSSVWKCLFYFVTRMYLIFNKVCHTWFPADLIWVILDIQFISLLGKTHFALYRTSGVMTSIVESDIICSVCVCWWLSS